MTNAPLRGRTGPEAVVLKTIQNHSTPAAHASGVPPGVRTLAFGVRACRGQRAGVQGVCHEVHGHERSVRGRLVRRRVVESGVQRRVLQFRVRLHVRLLRRWLLRRRLLLRHLLRRLGLLRVVSPDSDPNTPGCRTRTPGVVFPIPIAGFVYVERDADGLGS